MGLLLNEISTYKIGATLKGKNLLPSGSKFFPLTVAPILEAILGRMFQDISWVCV